MPSTKEIRAKIKSVQTPVRSLRLWNGGGLQDEEGSGPHARSPSVWRCHPEADRAFGLGCNRGNHTFLRNVDKVEKIGLICVSSDKGLAGALNTNSQRLIANKLREWAHEGKKVEATALGNKVLGFLQRVGVPVISQAIQLGDRPQLERLLGAIKVQIEAFEKGEVDVVYICTPALSTR